MNKTYKSQEAGMISLAVFSSRLILMDTPMRTDLQRHIYISFMWTLAAVCRTYQERWPIGMHDEEESRESELSIIIISYKKNLVSFSWICFDFKSSKFIVKLFPAFYCNSKLASGQNVHQWSRRPGFNPMLHHTKDFKNGTRYRLA